MAPISKTLWERSGVVAEPHDGNLRRRPVAIGIPVEDLGDLAPDEMVVGIEGRGALDELALVDLAAEFGKDVCHQVDFVARLELDDGVEVGARSGGVENW